MIAAWQFILFFSILITLTQPLPNIECIKYLLELKKISDINKVLEQIAPYMIYSGKQVDDLGFPKMCDDNGLKYTTVRLNTYVTDQHVSEHSDFLFNFYYGFCFTNLCSVNDLNQDGKFVIETIFQQMPVKIQSISFYDADIKSNVSAITIIMIALICLWIIVAMVGLFSKWFSQCQGKKQLQVQISIPLQEPDKKIEEQKIEVYEQPIKKGFFKWISIGRKWDYLWSKQRSTKISQFSCFKIISVPLTVYGYYFYLCNNGAFNIFAFNSQIYSSFYSNVATFSYYIPDIFFFMSGYLLTKNVFAEVQFAASKPMFLLKKLGRKLLRLYPIYIVCLIIFWSIVPSLHSGPVWMIYQEEKVDQCDTVWWRNILMIDNFFSQGCFNFSWWVQAQIQYTILALVTFLVLFINKRIGSMFLYLQVLASWILLFVLSQKLPVEIQITIKNESSHYFKSFHSHLPFYLTGVILASIIKKQSSKRLIKNYYFKNTIILLLGIGSAFAIFCLVLIRPNTFSYDSLNIELALCRTGILYSFIIYCLPGLIKQRINKTIVHKLAELTYPIILVSGIVVDGSYWGFEVFPYVSGQSVLSVTIPNIIISIIVGILLHLLFNFVRHKKSQPKII